MLKNYAVFPARNINITQNYDGISHYRQTNSTNGIKSYPIDIAYENLYLMAPCDVEVIKMNGFYNESVLNQIFIWSKEKVYFANGDYDYFTLLVGHINDWDFSSDLIGKTYKRGENIVKQGYDGTYIGNDHLDIVVAKGLQSTWVKNSYNEWVLPNSLKFEDVFYIDSNYNNVINLNGINFKEIPIDAYASLPDVVIRDENINQVEVIVTDLRVRTNPNLNAEIIGFCKEGIFNVLNTFKDDVYTWYEIEKDKWIASLEGWIIYYPKKEVKKESIIQRIKNLFVSTLNRIKNLFKK